MSDADSPVAPTGAAALEAAVEHLAGCLAAPGSATAEAVAALDPAAVQRLLTAAVSLYAAKVEGDGWIAPFEPGGPLPVPTASEVCLTTAQMLEAVSVEVFELALWKTWAHSAEQAGVDHEVRT